MNTPIVKVATLPPPFKDVDDLLRSDNGDARYEHMIDTALPAPSWMIGHLDIRHDLATTQGAVNACEDMVDMLLGQHPVARARYVRELAAKLGEEERTIRQMLNEAVQTRGAYYTEHPQDRPEGLPIHAIEAAVLHI